MIASLSLTESSPNDANLSVVSSALLIAKLPVPSAMVSIAVEGAVRVDDTAVAIALLDSAGSGTDAALLLLTVLSLLALLPVCGLEPALAFSDPVLGLLTTSGTVVACLTPVVGLDDEAVAVVVTVAVACDCDC